MPQKILGIDLGSWSVKGVLLESSFRGFRVEALHEEKLAPGDQEGPQDVGHPGEAGSRSRETKKQRQLEALGRLIGEPKLKGDIMIVGFPGELATMRWIVLPYGDPKKIEQTISGELADVLPFDIQDAVVDHDTIDRQKHESTSICAAAQSDQVGAFLESLHSQGVDPKFLPVDVLQLYNLYTHFLKEDASKAETPTAPSDESNTFIAPSPGGPPDARLLVDIGHERTLVCACYEKGIAHVRVLRAGGRDVTDAIAKAYQLQWADAEAGKHEDALATSSRRPATDDASQKMAEVVEQGLLTLVRELRRTIQTIRKEKRVRVARLDLLGGGSRIKNLSNYLAEQLNVPVAVGLAVEQAVEGQASAVDRATYALSLAAALRATADSPVSNLDLRVGEYQYAGQLQHLRQRAPLIAMAVGALTVLLMINTIVQYQVIGSREAAIDQQFCEITKKVVGREICEPTVAISVVKQPASELGNFQMPTKSAFRVAAELSSLVPKELDLTLSEMEITPDRARMTGIAKSFDAVDQLVSVYAANKCFTDIKKGKLRKVGDSTEGVEFQLSIQLECR